MPSPVTVALQVPYAENEQQFLVLAVQAAVRMFRSMNGPSTDRRDSLSSARSADSSPSSTNQAQQALQES